MNTSLLQFTLTLLVGSFIMINGVLVNTDDIIASAHSAVDNGNIHHIATLLELYHLEHDSYPNVVGGVALMQELGAAGLIQRGPYDPNKFYYEPIRDGRDYLLELH